MEQETSTASRPEMLLNANYPEPGSAAISNMATQNGIHVMAKRARPHCLSLIIYVIFIASVLTALGTTLENIKSDIKPHLDAAVLGPRLSSGIRSSEASNGPQICLTASNSKDGNFIREPDPCPELSHLPFDFMSYYEDQIDCQLFNPNPTRDTLSAIKFGGMSERRSMRLWKSYGNVNLLHGLTILLRKLFSLMSVLSMALYLITEICIFSTTTHSPLDPEVPADLHRSLSLGKKRIYSIAGYLIWQFLSALRSKPAVPDCEGDMSVTPLMTILGMSMLFGLFGVVIRLQDESGILGTIKQLYCIMKHRDTKSNSQFFVKQDMTQCEMVMKKARVAQWVDSQDSEYAHPRSY